MIISLLENQGKESGNLHFKEGKFMAMVLFVQFN